MANNKREQAIEAAMVATRDDILDLAKQLYADLPFWRRWKVFKYYKSNRWDVTDSWTWCVRNASKMVYDADYLISKYASDYETEAK